MGRFCRPGGSGAIGSDDIVYSFLEGTAPNRQLYIMNRSYEIDDNSYSYCTVVLEETTNKIYILDWHNDAVGAGSYTIGIQENASTAVQVSGSPNIQTSTGIGSNLADMFRYELEYGTCPSSF